MHNWARRLPSLVRVWQGTFGIQQESQRITFHPAGNYLLAIGYDEKACVIWRLDTDRVLDIPGNKDDILDASWNPAGDRLALGRSDCIEILSFPEFRRLAHIGCAEPVHAGRIPSVGRRASRRGTEGALLGLAPCDSLANGSWTILSS